MTTFLISDQHYGHSGIIRMCNRPFLRADGEPDVKAMDDCMIESHNAVVGKLDTVIMLGDFAHRAADDRLPKIFGALKGKKHLVLGNHDGAQTRALPWESQHDLWHVSVDSTNLVLCHYALRQWAKIRKGALMLYGHSHGKLPGNVQSCDIGVDVFGWSPVRLSTIQAHLATLPLMTDPEAKDDLEDGGLSL